VLRPIRFELTACDYTVEPGRVSPGARVQIVVDCARQLRRADGLGELHEASRQKNAARRQRF